METRICTKCREAKDRSQFSRDARRKDSLRSWCKSCAYDSYKAYKETERGRDAILRKERKRTQSEPRKQYKRSYRQSEVGKQKAAQDFKKWRESEHGRQKRKEQATRYRRSDSGRAAAKRHRVANQHKMKARQAVALAIRYGRLPHATDLACSACGARAQEYHHKNGYERQYWLDVVPMCIPCHRRLDNPPGGRGPQAQNVKVQSVRN